MTIQLPVWTLDAAYSRVERAFCDGSITEEQWDAYRAIWFYSAPRFSDIVNMPRVRDINATISRDMAIARSLSVQTHD